MRNSLCVGHFDFCIKSKSLLPTEQKEKLEKPVTNRQYVGNESLFRFNSRHNMVHLTEKRLTSSKKIKNVVGFYQHCFAETLIQLHH